MALEQALGDNPAELLHFFCHGVIRGGSQLLEFGSINDYDIGADAGSIHLSIERLREILVKGGTTWLTVLNSCSGAQAMPRLYSMASALTGKGSPITIGMAEPILNNDATLFAKSFYARAFEVLARALAGLPNGSMTAIDLGPAVGHARAALHAAYDQGPSDAFGRWCLPILYQRSAPLRVARIQQEMAQRIEEIAKALRGMSADTPGLLRDQILALLDGQPAVPAALRPDRYGNMP
nr:CHAT domain-containing protein [Sphingomonas xinjiangensis]